MYIAIDDTYTTGPNTSSKYVTNERRTHVAVVFPEEQVSRIRSEMKDCLEYVHQQLDIQVSEFHFVDIYNRNGAWKNIQNERNLLIFQTFAEIYKEFRWKVHVQTVDDRTFADLNMEIKSGILDGLDLSKRSDLSLFFLLLKIKSRHVGDPLTLIVDNRRDGEQGHRFGYDIFAGRKLPYEGTFQSSSKEPLLQIADFLAFCINRSTHLAMKPIKTEIDYFFLDLIGGMEINSEDITQGVFPIGFSVADFDEIHRLDRINKGRE